MAVGPPEGPACWGGPRRWCLHTSSQCSYGETGCGQSVGLGLRGDLERGLEEAGLGSYRDAGGIRDLGVSGLSGVIGLSGVGRGEGLA